MKRVDKPVGRGLRSAPGTPSGPFKQFALAAAAFLLLSAPFASAADTRLADAVEKQDRAAITLLLDQRTDLNAAQVDGMTALHWSVYQDNLDLAKRLVAAGAAVKTENRYGVTPLSLACTNGNTAMVELLLTAGADPNKPLRGGETPLMTAARTGLTGPVKALLDHGATVDAKDAQSQTALMWAAADGQVAVVNQLIAAGADLRTPLATGYTPLFFAVREGRTEVVRALLKAGLPINEPMQPKRTGGKFPKVGTTPLHLAVENGHFELAVALLDAGANPNDQGPGYTPLHMMTWVRKPSSGDDGDPSPVGSGNLNSLQFVRQLVAHGANVNLRLEKGVAGGGRLTRKGATAFLLASETADLPLMHLLLELGADPMLPNAEHATPLMAAAGVGTRAPIEEAATEDEALEAVQLLLSLGADINTVDDNGETAMHGAAYANFPKMVHFLAAKGAKIEIWNKKDKLGWTPQLVAEGHRPGNFKPSYETLDAVKEVMIANGVTPPPPTPYIPVMGYGK